VNSPSLKACTFSLTRRSLSRCVRQAQILEVVSPSISEWFFSSVFWQPFLDVFSSLDELRQCKPIFVFFWVGAPLCVWGVSVSFRLSLLDRTDSLLFECSADSRRLMATSAVGSIHSPGLFILLENEFVRFFPFVLSGLTFLIEDRFFYFKRLLVFLIRFTIFGNTPVGRSRKKRSRGVFNRPSYGFRHRPQGFSPLCEAALLHNGPTPRSEIGPALAVRSDPSFPP